MMKSSDSRLRLTASALILTLALAGCQQGPKPEGQRAGDIKQASSWDAFETNFINEYFVSHPAFAANAGKHEYDGMLPNWSEESLKAEIARLESKKGEALAFKDNVLEPSQRFARDYLVSVVRGELFWLKTADAPHKNPFYYADALDPDLYVSRPYASLEVRLDAYIRYAQAVPNALAQIQTNLKGPIPKTLIGIGKITIGGLADFYQNDVPKVFASLLQGQGSRRADFIIANEAAIAAVRDFSAWLSQRELTARDTGFALGADKFKAMILETEGVDLSIKELDAIARKDLDRNTKALEAACAQYAPGKSIRDCIAMATAHKPEGDVVGFAARQLVNLRSFVSQRNLVTIPGDEEVQVAESPAYKRWNLAYISVPGAYDKNLPYVYYVSPPDPAWSKQKQDEYIPSIGSLLFTSVHEVMPGHFVQFLHANRAASKFGQVFVGYAFAEGWAHYAEEMMWESGYGEASPEMHIGQLTEALLRNVRFLSAIGLHTKGMTVEESRQLFRDKAFTDDATAEEQARRGTFDPAYLNYTMGKLMIQKLRNDWTALYGGRAAWRDFHNQLLSYGGPPIPLVRRIMMGPSDKGSLF